MYRICPPVALQVRHRLLGRPPLDFGNDARDVPEPFGRANAAARIALHKNPVIGDGGDIGS